MIFVSQESARRNQVVEVNVLTDEDSRVNLKTVRCLVLVDEVFAGNEVELAPRPRTYGPQNDSITHQIVDVYLPEETEDDDEEDAS